MGAVKENEGTDATGGAAEGAELRTDDDTGAALETASVSIGLEPKLKLGVDVLGGTTEELKEMLLNIEALEVAMVCPLSDLTEDAKFTVGFGCTAAADVDV